MIEKHSNSATTSREHAYGWVIVIIAALAMAATLPGRTHGLGLVTKPLLADFPTLSQQDFGRINLWATLLGALFCLPCGWLLDRFGIRVLLTVVLASLAAIVLWMSAIRDVPSLLVAITLSGVSKPIVPLPIPEIVSTARTVGSTLSALL